MNQNPDNYINSTTVTVLSSSVVDTSSRTSEFTSLVANCTKVAYAYANPKENATAAYNTSPSGASSLCAYIFGYDSTTETEFLNTKKWLPYVLNKLYYTSSYKSTWYKTLVTKHPLYIILEKSGAVDGGEKFGNITDGFGMRLGAGIMENDTGREILFHEVAHAIWDTSATTNNFYVGVDSRTGIDYGTGNLITLFTKLYNTSIVNNSFYSGAYGWDYVHENFANTAGCFFTKDYQTQLLANDPVVYNIMSLIFNKFNF